MKLSIVIPIYNVEKYLDDCLNSISQLLLSDDFEIIAVNDGSTDNSCSILSKWKGKSENLKILNQANAGLSAARNAGLKVAKGDYIVFIDSDDHIDSVKLLEIVDKYRGISTDIIVNDYWEYIDGHIDTARKEHINALIDKQVNAKLFFKDQYKSIRSIVWRNLYNRKFLLKNKIYFHEGVYFEDVEFTPLTFSKARYVIYTGIPFYYYRKREASITTSCGSERKVNDALSIWGILNQEALKKENSIIAPIMHELGFHCFLNQYSIFNKCLPKDKLTIAKSLSSNKMESYKYTACSLLFRFLPNKAFHKLLKTLG